MFIDSSDIALIEIPFVEFNDVVQPVNGLACSSKYGIDVIAMGNGLMSSEDREVAEILQFTELKTVSLLKCFLYFRMLALHKSIMCAQGADKQSTCEGDSGKRKDLPGRSVMCFVTLRII